MVTEIEMAENGEFLREYGKQYFVVASEALSIGRVKWNMVPIGKNGQNDITFYLTTEQMLSLCNEILDGVFAKKIAADTNAFPGAYKYVTGEDGYLRLNIGGGKMGCRIQLQDAKAKTNYTMAVSIESINTMARKFMLCSGMTPVTPNSYYASVIAAFERGRAGRAKYRKPAIEDLGDVVDANNIVDDVSDDNANEATENTANANVAPTKSEEPAAHKTAQVKPEEGPVCENFTLVIRGTKSIKKGFYVFDGTDANGNAISLMFRKEDADKLNWFSKFENATAMEDTKLAIRGEKRDNFILYKGPAKK